MITETLMGAGGWDLQVNPDGMPRSLWSELDPDVGGFGHVMVFGGRVDPDALGDSGMKASARYTGVYAGTSGRGRLFGWGLLGWLGTPDGLGHVLEATQTGVDPTAAASDETFVAWVRDLLGAVDSITEGTLTAISGTYTNKLRLVTVKQALDLVCDRFSGEYRVNPDGTLDAGAESDLFVTDPEAVLLWDGGGREAGLSGLHGVGLDVARDLEDYTTKTVVVADGQRLGTSGGSDATFKDLHGNAMLRKRLIEGSSVTASTAGTVAAQQLGRFDGTRDAYRLSTDEWNLTGLVEVGDSVWVFDPRPDGKLVDTANQVEFRGQTIFPKKLRVRGWSWPVRRGMSVWFRDPDGGYHDLTPHVEFEDGAASLEVGATPRRLTSGSTSATRVEQHLQHAAGLLGYGERTSDQVVSSGTETDITGLSVTVDVGESRTVKVESKVRLQFAASGDRAVVRLYEDGSQVGSVVDFTSNRATEFVQGVGAAWSFSPSAGSHTFKATVQRVSGSGNVTVECSATNPSWLQVSDEGPDRT